MDLLLWPNLAVLELAPTTAMLAAERKVLIDASVLMMGSDEQSWKRRLRVNVLGSLDDGQRGVLFYGPVQRGLLLPSCPDTPNRKLRTVQMSGSSSRHCRAPRYRRAQFIWYWAPVHCPGRLPKCCQQDTTRLTGRQQEHDLCCHHLRQSPPPFSSAAVARRR